MDALGQPYELGFYVQRPVDFDSAGLALQNASGVVRAFCRWPIAPEYTETLTLDSEGGTVLQLPCLAVTAVASVIVDGMPITDFTWSADGMIQRLYAAPSAFPPFDLPINYGPIDLNPANNGYPAASGGFPAGFRRVTVTYTGGYATAPDEIRAVVLSAAARQYLNPLGVMQARAGGLDVQYPNARSGPKSGTVGGLMLSDDEERICGRYRIGRGT